MILWVSGVFYMKKTTVKKSQDHPYVSDFISRHPFLVPFVSFVLLFIVGLMLFVSLGGQTTGAADRRIVQLYYDGKSQTVPTRAKTVAELLQKLSVNVGPKDIVEPSLESPIVQDDFKINIYRARAVEVLDGQNRVVVQTATKSPKLVAKEAGIALLQEDVATFMRPDETLKGPVVAERLYIERSVPITVSLYGVLGEYRTTAATIQEFLDEKNIALKDGETTQPADPLTPLSENLFVSVNAAGKQVASVVEEVPYTIQTKTNPTLQAGQSRVAQKGVNGKKAVLYDIQSKDGVEVGRTLLQSVTITEPIVEIVEKGTLAVATYSVSEDKASIMAAAGIDPSQFASVDYIIQKESNWRPGAINAIGCIGLAQRCPSGGKNALAIACPSWQTDPVCQLRHFSAYANGRYGSWNAAYQVWVVQRWW